MSLGLGSNLSKGGLTTPGIVTDNLVLKHKYDAGAVVPVSDGAADINADAAANEYIDVGTIAISTNDITMCAWVYVTAFGANNAAYVANRESGGTNLGVTLRNDGTSSQFETIFDYGGGAYTCQSGTVNTHQWYHLCSVWDRSDKAYLYLDGVEVDTADISSKVSTDLSHSTNAFIGKNEGSVEVQAYICNVGYWNAALTQPQVKSIMNKNYAGLTDSEKTNLVSWWNLDSTISEDYNATSETDDSPSTINGMVLDNNDTTFTEVSVTNSDFTSGSGTSITGWTNEAANKWEISGSTIISPNGVSLISQAVLTNNITHKAIVRAKNTVPGSTSRLKVYFGANNNAQYELTDDFQEYVFHGYQDNDTTFFLYNESGAASTNVTIDWVKLYKYDGNVGVLV